MTSPAEDRERREDHDTGSERQRDELLRLVHGESPGRLVPWPSEERLTS